MMFDELSDSLNSFKSLVYPLINNPLQFYLKNIYSLFASAIENLNRFIEVFGTEVALIHVPSLPLLHLPI